MNIYAKEGDKVTVTEKTISYGYESDAKKAKKYLKVGEVYTVDHTDVSGWNTDVYLKEFPEISFNSVNFIDVEEKETNQ